MTQWTKIVGTFDLQTDVTIKSKTRCGNDTYKIPFKEEQCSIEENVYKNNKLKYFNLCITAYPIIKKIIDVSIKEYFPKGEYNIINYNLYYNKDRFDTSHSFIQIYELPIYKKLIMKKLNLYKWEEVKNKVSFHWIKENLHSVLTINDRVRYCSGLDILNSINNLFTDLNEHNIDILDGYAEWIDEWQNKYKYAVRTKKDEINFMILNNKTNKIIAWKKIITSYIVEEDEKVEIVKESNSWKKYI